MRNPNSWFVATVDARFDAERQLETLVGLNVVKAVPIPSDPTTLLVLLARSRQG